MVKKTTKSEYQEIELDLIDEPEGVIRLDIDQEEVESLADNIKEVGQIQPINLAIHGTRYEIIAGHLRYLALKKLGRKTIKAIVKTVPKNEIALIRASENLKRQNLTPIEEAAIYADLVDQYEMTKMGIAEKFGLAPSTIKNRLDLLTLHPDIQKLIHTGLMSIQVGVELNKVDNDRELHKSLRDAVNNGCSLETAQGWVADYRKSLTYEPSNPNKGGSLSPEIPMSPIYQACELCQKPVEIGDMKIIRVCPSCYDTIALNLRKGGE